MDIKSDNFFNCDSSVSSEPDELLPDEEELPDLDELLPDEEEPPDLDELLPDEEELPDLLLEELLDLLPDEELLPEELSVSDEDAALSLASSSSSDSVFRFSVISASGELTTSFLFSSPYFSEDITSW